MTSPQRWRTFEPGSEMRERVFLMMLMKRFGLSRPRAIALIAGCCAFVLAIGISTESNAEVITVDSVADGSINDVGTFRWAVNQANTNLDASDTILFDPSLKLLADGDGVVQIILTTVPLPIESELRLESFSFIDVFGNEIDAFIDIVADPDLDTFFQVRETITLDNVELRSDSTLFNGGDPGNERGIDLIYDVHEVKHDITWQLLDRAIGFPKDGDGRLVKLGTGELALFPSAADYSGGTLLVEGVLRTDAAGLTGDIQICADGTGADLGFLSNNCAGALLIFEMPGIRIDEELFSQPRATNGTYAGNITSVDVGGNGRVVKIGPGQLTLTGDNRGYEGDTFILEGEVVGDLDAIPGDVHICPGVLSVVDPNSPTDFDCDIENLSKLTFDISTDSTFSKQIHGQGIVAKDGPARLTIDASQLTFGGRVEIKRGELVVDNDLGVAGSSPTDVFVVVEAGALLSGSGTIGGNVEGERGGTIEGTLVIGEDLSLRGTLDLKDQVLTSVTARIDQRGVIRLDPMIAGGPGKLVTTGDVTLGKGSVDFVFDFDDLDNLVNGFFTVIETTGGAVVGTLTGGEDNDGVQSPLATYDLTLRYNDLTNCTGAGNVCLEAGFSPILEDDARSKNQREIARAIDHAYVCAQDPTSAECMISQETADDFNDVYTNFAVLSSQIPDILDEIAGEEYAAFADLRAAGTARFNRSISRRFDLERSPRSSEDVEAASSSSKTGESPTTPRSPYAIATATRTEWMTLGASALNVQDDPDFRDYRNRRFPWRRPKPEEPMPTERHAGGWTGWMDVHGVMGEVGGSKNADDVDYRIYGPLFGLDYGLTDILTVGITAGFTRNELKTPHSATKGTGTTYQVGAYAAAMMGDLYITGAGRFARSDVSTRKRIRFEAINRTAKADFNASDASAFLEAAYAFSFQRDLTVQPVVSVAYNRLHQGSFEERRTGSLNLDIDSQNIDALQTHIGVRLGIFATPEDGGYLLPQLRIGYERELLDNERDVSGNLGSAGENGKFDLTGISLPRDRAVIGVSSEVGVSNSTHLFIDYDLRAAKDFLEHSLSFGVRAIW